MWPRGPNWDATWDAQYSWQRMSTDQVARENVGAWWRRRRAHTNPVRSTGGRIASGSRPGRRPASPWLEGRYGRTLRSSEGRAGIGAQRFLTLLGAETAPRPSPHPDLVQRYSSQPAGLRALLDGSPAGRSQALADQGATYTLTDSDCPAMNRVIEDIARMRQGGRRRKKGSGTVGDRGAGMGTAKRFRGGGDRR